MSIVFRKATRRAVKVKLAVQGPSGAGKTVAMLELLKALAEGGRIAVIDTENGSASLYADRYDFEVLDLAPPYTSVRYIEAIEAATEAGFAAIGVDSLSHQWIGEGGILSRKEALDARPGSNSYTNWATFTKEHEMFKARILNAPVHLIATMRAKQDYVLETNERGKQTPKKVGMAPVQREGVEYEFTTVFELQMDHRAIVSKDRTGLFGGSSDPIDLLRPDTGKALLAWLKEAPDQRPPVSPLELKRVKALAVKAGFTAENWAEHVNKTLDGRVIESGEDLIQVEKALPPVKTDAS